MKTFDLETLRLSIRAAMLAPIASQEAAKVAKLLPEEVQDIVIEEAIKLTNILDID